VTQKNDQSWRKLIAWGACVVLSMGLALAQNRTTAEIRGLVTDTTGAVVPSVKITVVNDETKVARTLQSDSSGMFAVPLLPPGQYTLEFVCDGFRKLVRSGVELRLDQVARVDVTLQLGNLAESITVNARSPLVDTETAERRLGLSTQMIGNLPVPGRNPYMLLALSAGISTAQSGVNALTEERMSVNGARAFGVTSTLNGGVTTLTQSSNNAIQVPLDSIQEMNLTTNNFSAEFGNGAAVLNVATRSGTNQFHGSAFEELQNDKLDAKNFFAVSKPPKRFHTFGGSLGGRILPNRTFFFASYQQNLPSNPEVYLVTVPTTATRAGDFSAPGLPAVHDPDTTQLVSGKLIRTPFPENRIPASRIDGVAAKVAAYWPEPNRSGIANNLYHAGGLKEPRGKYSGKIDHNFSESQRLSGAYHYDGRVATWDGPIPNPVGCMTNCGESRVTDQHVTLADTWIVSPSVVNEARVTVLRENYTRSAPSEGMNIPETLGLRNVPQNYFPNFSISGTISTSIGPGSRAKTIQNTYAVANVLMWMKGRHIVKVGGDYTKYQINSGSVWDSGSFSFSGLFSNSGGTGGMGLADFLLGLPNSYSLSIRPAMLGGRRWGGHTFVQDELKLTQKLTLNAGLRVESESGFSEAYNRMTTFDPTIPNPVNGLPGAIWFASDGDRALQKTHHGLLAPRIGLAYAIAPKWSVRAGWGMFYVAPSGQVNNNTSPVGYTATESMATTDQRTPVFKLSVGPPPYKLPDPSKNTADMMNGKAVSYAPRDAKMGTNQQWHLTIQRELPGGVVVETAYVGSRGLHLLFRRDMNQVPPNLLGPGDAQTRRPFPNFLAVNTNEQDANSIYHSFQLTVNKRFSQGLTFAATYTLSKSIDESSYEFTTARGGEVQIVSRRDLNRALSQFDVPQRATAAVVYEMPVGRGRRYQISSRVLDGVLGGWRMSSIFVANSGMPFTVSMSGANLSGSLAGSWFPNRIRDGALPESERSIYGWFDTTAFTTPAQYAFGNAGRNILRTPGLWNADFSLAKEFRIPMPRLESSKLEIKALSTNVFNHPNFGAPASSIGAATVGRITTAGAARMIQLGARYEF
jgi:hypothetical protein